jgi:GNAT superfamily N-acetyltransferase
MAAVTDRASFREANDVDLPEIIALLAEDTIPAGREDASLPLDKCYERAFAAIQADPNQRLIVAELDGRVVGCLQLTFIPGLAFRGAWRGLIESVRIASDLRGLRLGEALIGHAVEKSRAFGCRMVQLTSSKSRADAHRFYERLGWARSHEGFKLTLE